MYSLIVLEVGSPLSRSGSAGFWCGVSSWLADDCFLALSSQNLFLACAHVEVKIEAEAEEGTERDREVQSRLSAL